MFRVKSLLYKAHFLADLPEYVCDAGTLPEVGIDNRRARRTHGRLEQVAQHGENGMELLKRTIFRFDLWCRMDTDRERKLREGYQLHSELSYSTCICAFTWDSILQAFITRETNMIWRRNLYQSTSLAKAQKDLEVHGSKPWVTNLSIDSHTLGILTAEVTVHLDWKIFVTKIYRRLNFCMLLFSSLYLFDGNWHRSNFNICTCVATEIGIVVITHVFSNKNISTV